MQITLDPIENTQTIALAPQPHTSAMPSPGSPDNGQAGAADLLAQRAARLAELPEQEETGEQITLLLVRFGHEVYGLEAQHVDRVQLVEQITPVPRVPNWVIGMTNLRGQLLSVVDLVSFFGLPSTMQHVASEDADGPAPERCLVVVSTSEIEIALLADGVLAVETVPDSRLQEAETIVRGLRPEYVRGIVQRVGQGRTADGANGSLVVVLDLQAILNDERLVIHDEIV
jgi:purine-binding chemotaxis protein CheW